MERANASSEERSAYETYLAGYHGILAPLSFEKWHNRSGRHLSRTTETTERLVPRNVQTCKSEIYVVCPKPDQCNVAGRCLEAELRKAPEHTRKALESTPSKSATHDPVNRPKHYTNHPSGVECIEITRHMNFNLGNSIKYIWRANLRGNAVEDLQKARWYLADEIRRLGGEP